MVYQNLLEKQQCTKNGTYSLPGKTLKNGLAVNLLILSPWLLWNVYFSHIKDTDITDAVRNTFQICCDLNCKKLTDVEHHNMHMSKKDMLTTLPDCRQFYEKYCMEYRYEYFADSGIGNWWWLYRSRKTIATVKHFRLRLLQNETGWQTQVVLGPWQCLSLCYISRSYKYLSKFTTF